MSSTISTSSVTDIVVRIIISAVILATTYLITFGFGRLVVQAIGRRSRSSAYEIGRVGSTVIWIIGILSILPVLGASEIVVAVVILLVGAFLILATRDFSNNWFAGQMIKAIGPFKIGDWIRTTDGSYGRVAKIEGLYTLLVTPQNEIVVIPNSKLTSDLLLDRTTSGSLKVPVELELDRGVEFGQFTLAVSRIMEDLGQNFTDSAPKGNGPEIYLVSTTPDSIKVRIFLRIDNAAKEEEVASEFRKRFSVSGLERRKANVPG
ncbi:MAG: mechanosensitive ion channel family protein [Thaumarchaeota archaeon]|nr:mechanosensitive ion channel family protein [Nitrososphaerota archaeon]